MLDALLDIALDLTATLSSEERYERLVAAVRRVVPADAIALLRWSDGALVPVAVEGLLPAALEQRFAPGEHPRLDAILASRRPTRFSAGDPMPDPWDGLVADSPGHRTHVHSCMGCSLHLGDRLVGALTVDAIEPGAFDAVDDDAVATFAALAAAAMHTAGLIDALERVAERRGQVSRALVNAALAREGGELVGTSHVMAELKRELRLIAPSDLTVLITGETGVGKELVARSIHAWSSRAPQPLVYVNCAALPESIAESELFGHKRGAFTGAVEHRAGKFELADGGTLFLDEVGELTPGIQAKLLRALQSGEIQRVGADRTLHTDVRVVAATNRDLAQEVASGRFRPDLYHRLAVYPVHVPALRDRRSDIPLLARLFLDRARVRLGLTGARFTPQALDRLEQAAWPGNVRELEHVVTRGALRASGGQPRARVLVDLKHIDTEPVALPVAAEAPLTPARAAVGLADATRAYQGRLIRHAVDQAGGNWAQAARQLGMHRANLHRLARRLGLAPSDPD